MYICTIEDKRYNNLKNTVLLETCPSFSAVFYFMEKLEWHPVFYNGLETNVEVTRCGRVRRVKVDWMKRNTSIGEVNFSKLKLHPQGYKIIGIQIKDLKPKTIQIQQLVAASFLGYNFNGHKLVVDHKDDNKLNNHIDNLQIITQRENNSKERTLKSGLPVGVCFRKDINKYRSQIYLNGKIKYLGCYNTSEEASNAYQNKLKEISIHKNS